MPAVSGWLSVFDEKVGRYIVICEVRRKDTRDDLLVLWGKLTVIIPYVTEVLDWSAPHKFRLTIGHLKPEQFTGRLSSVTPTPDGKFVEIEITKIAEEAN